MKQLWIPIPPTNKSYIPLAAASSSPTETKPTSHSLITGVQVPTCAIGALTTTFTPSELEEEEKNVFDKAAVMLNIVVLLLDDEEVVWESPVEQ